MKRLFSFLLLTTAAFAQSVPPSVTAQGSATINAQPDQATLSVSISTNGSSAQDAGQQNANLTATVVGALQKLIGSNGTIVTTSYYVTPRYSNGTSNSAPAIVGYTATISEQVTLNNLTLIGQTIDTANGAGATSVSGLTLGLQNPEPSLESALAAASKQALTHAASIASGLGGKVGPVISAQQSSTYTPIFSAGPTGAAASTTVNTGPVSVTASVTVTAQLQ
jgi:uncharacterized protein YggE